MAGISTRTGHWLAQALHDRQVDSDVLSSASIACRAVAPATDGAACCTLSRRAHSRSKVARPLGDCVRSRVALYEGHIGSLASQEKQAPLPLQATARSTACMRIASIW